MLKDAGRPDGRSNLNVGLCGWRIRCCPMYIYLDWQSVRSVNNGQDKWYFFVNSKKLNNNIRLFPKVHILNFWLVMTASYVFCVTYFHFAQPPWYYIEGTSAIDKLKVLYSLMYTLPHAACLHPSSSTFFTLLFLSLSLITRVPSQQQCPTVPPSSPLLLHNREPCDPFGRHDGGTFYRNSLKELTVLTDVVNWGKTPLQWVYNLERHENLKFFFRNMSTEN